MLEFVRARGFATLVDPELRVVQVPLLIDDEGERALLHLSRANAMRMPTRAVVVVGGADGYISPDWYGSAEQVPTWNYESVELSGTLTPTDESTLLSMLERLSSIHEGRLVGKEPWTMAKLSATKQAALIKGIVGATLAIEAIRGTRKLSQNKSRAEREAVIGALAKSQSERDRELAARMSQVREVLGRPRQV